MKLWDFQETAVDDVDLALQFGANVCYVAPTGSGKTVVCGTVAKRWRDRGKHVLWLAHRRELVDQAAHKLAELRTPAGVIMAGRYPNFHAEIQVASIATLRAWVKKTTMSLPRVNLVVIDEAHGALGPEYDKLCDHYNDLSVPILGPTATPIRSDGVGLGQRFSRMVKAPGTRTLMNRGFLVPKIDYYAPFIPDLKKIRIKAGDYDDKQLAEIYKQRHIVGDIIANWLRLTPGASTIAFCAGVGCSMHTAEAFRMAGIPAGHIDANTPTRERDEMLRDLNEGRLLVMCNDSVFAEGTDVPRVSTIINAKPTKSIGRYMQTGGRGTRAFPGKDRMVYIDHSGASLSLGRLDVDFPWELVMGKEMVEKHAKRREHETITFVCEQCAAEFTGRVTCPMCGLRIERKPEFRDYLDGDLVKLTYSAHERNMARIAALAKMPTYEDKCQFYRELMGYARDWNETQRQKNDRLVARGKDPKKLRGRKWAAAIFKAKFNEWPSDHWIELGGLEASPQVKRYVQSRGIRYGAKMKKQRALERANG